MDRHIHGVRLGAYVMGLAEEAAMEETIPVYNRGAVPGYLVVRVVLQVARDGVAVEVCLLHCVLVLFNAFDQRLAGLANVSGITSWSLTRYAVDNI